ncbi:MAG: hypothetical protein KY476_12595 [Planctomycetes bacterium]|nr:hypothetical protein [Planctomycetota bacterium]
MVEYAFPQDLLDAIKGRWNAVPSRPGFDLPDDHTLQRLLETCYHASLRTEEQRPVHCVVAYAPVSELPSEALLLFDRETELTDDQIVRLAPVTDIRRTLIGCEHRDGRLRIWGLFEHGHAWEQYSARAPRDAPAEATDLPPDCLTIAIEGPGALSVARGRRGLVRLRAGRIIVPQENPLRNVDGPLGRFFLELAEDLRHSPLYRDRLASADESDQGRSLLEIYSTSLAGILEHIRLRREGGSLVIARSPLDAAFAQITYTVAGHTGLADRIVTHHEALRDLLRMPPARPNVAAELERCRAAAALRLASRHLLRGINQISLLAAVDGAVLLDNHLRIQGFGVRFPVLLSVGASILHAATDVEYACDQWGLRHQSVFSVCQKCEQAVGLIVSQDGGVKAVKSVEGKLRLWDGILD